MNTVQFLNRRFYGSQDAGIHKMDACVFSGTFVETRKFEFGLLTNTDSFTISKENDYLDNYGFTNIQISNIKAVNSIQFNIGGQRINKVYPNLYNIPLIEEGCVYPAVQWHDMKLYVSNTDFVEITVDIIKIDTLKLYKTNNLYQKVYTHTIKDIDVHKVYNLHEEKYMKDIPCHAAEMLINTPQYIGEEKLEKGENKFFNSYNHPINKLTLLSTIKLNSPIFTILIYNFQFEYKGTYDDKYHYEIVFDLPLNFSRLKYEDAYTKIFTEETGSIHLFVNTLQILRMMVGMYGLAFSK